MAKAFDLPANLKKAGWKLKIRDRETVEPPHATVIYKTESWRWDLRRQKFMDRRPPPRKVPKVIQVFLKMAENHTAMVEAWDAKYPHNKVGGESED
jgi:hypothetical protein